MTPKAADIYPMATPLQVASHCKQLQIIKHCLVQVQGWPLSCVQRSVGRLCTCSPFGGGAGECRLQLLGIFAHFGTRVTQLHPPGSVMAQEKGVYYCYVSSRHQLGAACQTKRPISLVTWPDLADLCYRLNEKRHRDIGDAGMPF